MFKKIFFTVFLMIFAIVLSWSQVDMSAYKSSISSFADEVAGAFPFATSFSNNWSDAYIGKFPHMGVGLTLGAVLMPSDSFKTLFDAFGGAPDELGGSAVPLPVWSIDARLGGFILPFDIGVSLGAVPTDTALGDVAVNYFLFGADIRYALVKQSTLKPDLSVSVGYKYSKGDITAANPFGATVDIDYDGFVGADAILTGPDAGILWESKSLEFKAQTSKSFLFLRLYLGAGLIYSQTTVGSGLFSTIDGATETALLGLGYDVDSEGFTYESEESGFTKNVYGGIGFIILIIKADAIIGYNIDSGSFGAGLNGRIQF